MLLLSQPKDDVVISAPTALTGKFGKGRRVSTLGFTVWGISGVTWEASNVAPGRGIRAVTGIRLERHTASALPRVSQGQGLPES